MGKPDRAAALQAALVAVRDSLSGVGHPWMDRQATTSTRGVQRMTIRLEPVWEPVTNSALVVALAKQSFRPRTGRARPGVDLRVVHVPSGVEVDFMIAITLSKRTQKRLDTTLGRGWRARGPKRRKESGST